MGRKSRKDTVYRVAEITSEKQAYSYKAALYARISVETEEKIERDTMGTQIALLQEFAAGIPDLVVDEIYVDDDISGSSFDRPAYEQMMRDVDKGKINCIIVKDLSRFARNHINAGEYLEIIFPQKGVRFIAITDNIDTLQGDGGIIVPFKNVLNERYAKESSMKLTANFKVMQKDGQFCSSKAPYGYIRSLDDKHVFDIDQEAAEVVRQIFEWFISGKTKHWICKELERRGIPCPSLYALNRGFFKEQHGVSKVVTWNPEQISKIVRMRQYCGDMVQNKVESVFLLTGKKGTFKSNKEEDWIIVENTHEPIISREMFQAAQLILEENARKHAEKLEMNKHIVNPEYCLRGVMTCGHCGVKMVVKRRVKNGVAKYSYVCPKHDCFGNVKCVKKDMPFDDTNEVVFWIIKRYIGSFLDTDKAIKELRKSNEGKNQRKILQDKIRAAEVQIRKCNKIKSGLYRDFCEQLLDETDYLYMSHKYSEEIEQLEKELEETKQQTEAYIRQENLSDDAESIIRKFINTRKLNISMVESFIQSIIVDNEGRFEVELKMKDEYESLLRDLDMMKGEMQSA